MSSFNLVQIIPSLDSGGVEKGTIDIANFLAEKKIKNYIITQGGRMINELNQEYTHVYLHPIKTKNFFIYQKKKKKINKFINKNNINLLHVRSRGPAWIVNFLKNKNVKTISTFHNVYGGTFFLKKLYNKGLSHMDHIVAISDYVKETIVKKYNINPNKILVINRGIDTNFFNQKTDQNLKNTLIKKLNIDTTKKIILFPARLTGWKGQLEFLNIVKNLDLKNISVLFLGDTKNKSYTKLIQEKITKENLDTSCKVLGDVNSLEMKYLYEIADLSLSFPIRAEGFGRTVSESLYSNTLVLAFNFGGVKNQLKDLSDIFKVKPFKYEDLPNRIDKLLNLDLSIKKELLEKAKSIIENNFSKQNMVNKYLAMYESIKF